MKKYWMTCIAALSLIGAQAQSGTYKTDHGIVSFYAKAPVADVDAVNKAAKVELNSSSRELTINLDMTAFEFKNGKMGRDAHKSYLEIEKFPKADFKGKITGDVDFAKAGTYPVTATGKLKVHGVEKEISEKGTITIASGEARLKSEFHVQLKDFKVETPKILGKKMTDENIRVNLEAALAGAKADNSKK